MIYDNTTKEVFFDGLKTFVIPHPLDDDKFLVHACLEGPEAGVYYRGVGELINTETGVDIVLPTYVSKLAEEFTVNLTPIYDGNVIKGYLCASEVIGGMFTVHGTEPCRFSWIVYGRRLEVQTEPNKDGMAICGNGPYTYLCRRSGPFAEDLTAILQQDAEEFSRKRARETDSIVEDEDFVIDEPVSKNAHIEDQTIFTEDTQMPTEM
jgi:hypothetical protein